MGSHKEQLKGDVSTRVARPRSRVSSRVLSLARWLFLVWNKFRDVENMLHTLVEYLRNYRLGTDGTWES